MNFKIPAFLKKEVRIKIQINKESPIRFIIIVTTPLVCLFKFKKNKIRQNEEIPKPSQPIIIKKTDFLKIKITIEKTNNISVKINRPVNS